MASRLGQHRRATSQVVKVYVYPVDMWGCGHYRMIWPALAVDEPGMTVELVEPGSRHIAIHVDSAGRVADESFPEDADVVVFQRPTNRWVVDTMILLQSRGVAVVVELDDDLAHVHPANPAWELLQPTLRHGRQSARNMHDLSCLIDAVRIADMVVVSTQELYAKYGAHGRSRLLRNRVPARYLDIPRIDSDLIGWGGSVHSHPDDLQQVGSAIAALVRRGARFKTVGDPADVAKALGLPGEPESSGPVPMDDYPRAVAQFGIGIAPLADTRFNRCKSWLKPLEYSAVGVPWVASPLPEYQALYNMSCGCLARRPRDWQGQLSALRDSEQLRAELSEAGRVVAAQNTVEGHAWRWAEAWSDAVTNRRDNPSRLVATSKKKPKGSLAQRARRLPA